MAAVASRRAANTNLKVLIVGHSFTLPYRVMRACAAVGARVTVLGNSLGRGLRFSRYCDRFQFTPVSLAGDAPDMAAEEINRFIREIGPTIILPGDAPATGLLSTIQAQLTAPCFPLPPPAIFDLLNNKWVFTQRAEALGIQCPATQLFADGDALRNALRDGNIRLPSIAKPLSADGAIGIVPLRPEMALSDAAKIDYAPVLVQDFITGEDIGASIFALNGEVRCHIVHRMKRRTYTVLDQPSVIRDLSLLARDLKLSGVYNFDMRLTPDGSLYYLECNPRFFYKMDLSMIAGINFAAAGLPGCGGDVPAEVPPWTQVRLPKALAADLIRPLSLTRRDWRMFRYLWSDPISYARERLGIDGED